MTEKDVVLWRFFKVKRKKQNIIKVWYTMTDGYLFLNCMYFKFSKTYYNVSLFEGFMDLEPIFSELTNSNKLHYVNLH